MVAYNFQAQFAPKIKSGEKRTTIRAPRQHSRHAYPGETMQLYTGQRTAHCEKLLTPDPLCVATLPICIEPDLRRERFRIILGVTVLIGAHREDIAALDGFDNSVELIKFFLKQHQLPFHGFWIKWAPDI